MWLELLSGIEARRYPVTPLEHPTPLTVEVRIICWRSKDVVSMDEWSGLNDLYAKFWLETKPNIQKDTVNLSLEYLLCCYYIRNF